MNRITWVLLGVGVSTAVGFARLWFTLDANHQTDTRPSAAVERTEAIHKLSDEIQQLMTSTEHLEQAAESKGLSVDQERLKVQIALKDPKHTVEVETRVQALGGEPITSFAGVVFAWMPLTSLGPLTAIDTVQYIDATRPTTAPLNQKTEESSPGTFKNDSTEAEPR